jgi:hypothetical protein
MNAEALRQQLLLRVLWGDARAGMIAGWLRDAPQRRTRGLQAYRANAGALAARALGAAFPTIAQLVGEESFAALARALWHAHPPQHGDIAQWGAALPAFIAAALQLADEPYLADVARLDWAVHQAEQAADHDGAVDGLQRLAESDPATLGLRLAEGVALIASPHPVVSIWQAHRSDAQERFAAVRQAFARGQGEQALVLREGFKVRVSAVPAATARFMQALSDSASLSRALDEAGPDFAFDGWLARALQQRWLLSIDLRGSIP